MASNSFYFCFGSESVTYSRRDGSVVNNDFLYHFSLDFLSDSLQCGSPLLKLDLSPSSFSTSQFTFPGIYRLSKKSLPSRGAPALLTSFELVDTPQFSSSYYLLFGIKEFLLDYSKLPPNYRTSKTGSRRGLKFFGLDGTKTSLPNFSGYLPFTGTSYSSSISFDEFDKYLPALVDCDFRDIRGSDGNNLTELINVSLIDRVGLFDPYLSTFKGVV